MFVGHHLGAAGGVVGGDDVDALQRPQKPLALRQRLRVRVDPPQPLDRRPRQSEQLVDDRQLDLGLNRQLVRDQQVVVAMNTAPNRVLNRQNPVVGLPALDGGKHVLEALARQRLRIGGDAPPGRLAERARLPLIGHLHKASLKHEEPSPGVDDGPLTCIYSGTYIIRGPGPRIPTRTTPTTLAGRIS